MYNNAFSMNLNTTISSLPSNPFSIPPQLVSIPHYVHYFL